MERIRRDALGADAAKQIRNAILEGRLTPGSRIDQDELAAQLGVSRLPIRQALLTLSREGLVSMEHRRGAAVTPVDTRFIEDLYDFRAAVDAQVAATLARRRDFDPRALLAIVAEGPYNGPTSVACATGHRFVGQDIDVTA
jgi:DNA-binding GntR family transcriptional regulator